MFRERLKKVTGCLRCRQRRAKCDEKRPKCSYCQKWNLPCSWPPFAKPNGEASSSATRTGISSSTPVRDDANDISPSQNLVHQPKIDHFGQLARSIPGGRPRLEGFDEVLCIKMIEFCLPFDTLVDQKARALDYLEWAMSDEALYSAFLAWCASLHQHQIDDVMHPHLRLELDVRTVSVLRRRIESGTSLTEATISAATLHFLKVLQDGNTYAIRNIVGGIYTMVESRGGFRLFSLGIRPTSIFSLWACDSFLSILDARSPKFMPEGEPERPQSFDEIYHDEDLTKKLCQHLSPDIIDAIGYLRFLLYFRHPSKQSRPLASQETEYMVYTNPFLDIKLGELQKKYLHQKTISEVTVITLLLTKIDVFGGFSQHPLLIWNILQRLSEAILSSVPEGNALYQMIQLWACFVAMAGSNFEVIRSSFLQPALSVLTKIYGHRPWPVHWRNEVHRKFESFIWHSRLDAWYIKTCSAMETTPQQDLSGYLITDLTDKMQHSMRTGSRKAC